MKENVRRRQVMSYEGQDAQRIFEKGKAAGNTYD
jgi:hypothetical protein